MSRYIDAIAPTFAEVLEDFLGWCDLDTPSLLALGLAALALVYFATSRPRLTITVSCPFCHGSGVPRDEPQPPF